MHLFYTPDITNDLYTLNEEESKHCVRVLRLAMHDKIQLIDGKGGWYEAEIIDDHPKRCGVRIIQTIKDFGKRKWTLHVAIAPTKNIDRLEWFAEKATEVGIDEISLIECHNSERTIVKTERLNKVLVSAIKQSLKAYLPKLNEVTRFKNFIEASSHFKGQKFIAHCHPLPEEKKPSEKSAIKNSYAAGENAMVLIGPEGDFSLDEVQLAKSAGFSEISLGSSRLRTETAALYACTLLNAINE